MQKLQIVKFVPEGDRGVGLETPNHVKALCWFLRFLFLHLLCGVALPPNKWYQSCGSDLGRKKGEEGASGSASQQKVPALQCQERLVQSSF